MRILSHHPARHSLRDCKGAADIDAEKLVKRSDVAGAAGHETRRLADLAIDEIARFIAGQPLRHQVVETALSTMA